DGLDVAIQQAGGRRWQSVSPQQSTAYGFALRSDRMFDGNYLWKVSNYKSTSWFDFQNIPESELVGTGPDGQTYRFSFAGPLHGLQNEKLFEARGGAAVWINVEDLDRDGNWNINASFEQITTFENTSQVPIGEPRHTGFQVTGGED